MQLPLVEPAPIVVQHTLAFRDLFENRKQFRHVQNYLTGLIVLDNKTMTNMSRCRLDSADKTNLSRFFSEAPWCPEEVNARRIEYLLEQTEVQRGCVADSWLIIADTLCEHVGTLFEHIDRHYNHCDTTYPLAHNLVTGHYISDAVRFPVDVRLYRRYEEVTQWGTFVKKHVSDREIPRAKKARTQLHKEIDPILLTNPEFHALAAEVHTKMSLAADLVQQAIAQQFRLQPVLMDRWLLAPELVDALAQFHKDWISLITHNRKLEVASFSVRDEQGRAVRINGAHINVDALVALQPPSAYKPVTIGESTYDCFTKSVRIPSLGPVRIVICFDNPELTGPYAVLITNRREWTAKKILRKYWQRWPLETFYQDGKGYWGLAAYRMRTAEAIKKHWRLVFVAYSLAHRDCLPTDPIEDTGKLPAHPIKTIGEVCRQQVQTLIQALILFAHKLLETGESTQEVFAKLFAKQHAFAAS